MKEAQPIADAGSLNLEASPATRRTAADGGESTRDAAAQVTHGQRTDAGRSSLSPEAAAQLAAEDADRFAMAFRPSWEPVAPVPTDVGPKNGRFRSFAPSLAPVVPHVVNDAGGFLQDDLLRLRAARVRKRSLALAAVSILSFGALMYWGITSTTDGAETSATRGLQPPPAAVDSTEAVAPTDAVAPAAPATTAAPELHKLSARLADPNAPPAAPATEAAANEAQQAEAAQPAEAQQAEAAQPNAAAATKPSPAPASAEAKPTAAGPGDDVKPPAVVTDVKPATDTAEVKPAAPAAEAKTTSAEAPKLRPPLLVVRAVPDSAQLFLDGQPVSNPFDTRLPLGSKHKLDARQTGYEASSQSIRLESDAKLTITLKRATPAPAPEPQLKARPVPESPNGAGFVTSNPY